MSERYTPDLLKRLAREMNLLHDPETPGWVSNRHWLVRVTSTDAFDTRAHSAPGAFRRNIDAVLKASRVRVHERVDLRMPRVVSKRLEDDGGCDGCECGACEGWANKVEVEYVEKLGQAVFVDEAGHALCCDPEYRELLDGLSIYHADDETRFPMLVGFDENGELVALVAPLSSPPEMPEAPSDG